MLAIGLALIASFCFAAAMIFINRGVLVLDYFRGLLTNLGINALFLRSFFFANDRRQRISWAPSRSSAVSLRSRGKAPQRVGARAISYFPSQRLFCLRAETTWSASACSKSARRF